MRLNQSADNNEVGSCIYQPKRCASCEPCAKKAQCLEFLAGAFSKKSLPLNDRMEHWVLHRVNRGVIGISKQPPGPVHRAEEDHSANIPPDNLSFQFSRHCIPPRSI